jgi:glutaredoxin 3
VSQMSQPQRHRSLGFTTPTCPWCQRTQLCLSSRGVPFRDVDVARDPQAGRDLVLRTGEMGVPVIEIDGRPIVGFDRPRIDRPRIDRLLAGVRAKEVHTAEADVSSCGAAVLVRRGIAIGR